MRYFLSRLAREVGRGRIELHAYCILTTHFHLLVRSPIGELSEAMRRSENEYSRYFNRRHARDGALVRGRFLSRPIETVAYRKNVLRYIDRNPVKAGVVRSARDYPWGSAAHYANPSGPIWLDRSWVERWVREDSGVGRFSARSYGLVVSGGATEGAARVVEDRLRCASRATDDLDDLIAAAPARVRAWMRRKARLADGGELGLPVSDLRSVRSSVERARAHGGAWTVRPAGRDQDAWELAELALMRHLAGMTYGQIETATGTKRSRAQRLIRSFDFQNRECEEFAARATDLAVSCIRECHGDPRGVDRRVRDRLMAASDPI